jgi:hypothetical protein
VAALVRSPDLPLTSQVTISGWNTDLPDPQITADGIHQQLPTGVNRDDPRLSAAEQTCGRQYPAPDTAPRPGPCHQPQSSDRDATLR